MAKNTIIENKLLATDIGGFTLVPVGTIVPYPGEQAPLGWMFCDGRSITKEQYPELYAIVGSKIPDLRGEFIRGLDRGRGVDPNRVLGSSQADDMRDMIDKHSTSGGLPITTEKGAATNSILFKNTTGPQKFFVDGTGTISTVNLGIDTSAHTGGVEAMLMKLPNGPETRPRNVAMNYIIKYRHIASHVGALDAETELNNNKLDKGGYQGTGKNLYDKIVGTMGKEDGKFPLTTATKDNVYFLESNGKSYICIENYNGTQISVPNANFEELSVFQNRKDIRNICTINGIKTNLIIESKTIIVSSGTFVSFDRPFPNKCISVMLTDIGSPGSVFNQALDNSGITQNGFTAITTHSSKETFMYTAIGY